MGDALPHPAWVKKQVLRAAVDVHRMVNASNAISDNRYPKLADAISNDLRRTGRRAGRGLKRSPLVVVPGSAESAPSMPGLVGGKMANLGEIRNGIGLPTPPGFAVTTEAYQSIIRAHGFLPDDTA